MPFWRPSFTKPHKWAPALSILNKCTGAAWVEGLVSHIENLAEHMPGPGQALIFTPDASETPKGS